MVVKFINWIKSLFTSKPKKIRKRVISDDEFNARRKGREDKLNSILDKVARHGYDGLSQHEKNFLDNYYN